MTLCPCYDICTVYVVTYWACDETSLLVLVVLSASRLWVVTCVSRDVSNVCNKNGCDGEVDLDAR